MQALRRVGEQIAVLVDGAALGGDIIPQRSQCLLQPGPAVDNQKLRLAQPALDQIVENGAPRRAGLAAHALDRQQHLLAVLANPEPDQEHNRGGFAVEPNPHHGAVEDQADDRLVSERAHVPGIPIGFYLPPHPAHGIFSDRTAKDGSERPAHSTAVGAGKIGACDQRIGSPGSPLVSPQRRALPFRGPARSGVEPSPRYRDLHSTESPDQRSGSMAVPVAGDLLRADGVVGSSLWPAAIARARKHRLELGFDHRLDEAANLVAQSGFNRIKPVVEEPGTRLGFRLRDWQLRAIIRHGVVSTGARTPDRWGFNTRRLRHLQFQPHPRRHPPAIPAGQEVVIETISFTGFGDSDKSVLVPTISTIAAGFFQTYFLTPISDTGAFQPTNADFSGVQSARLYADPGTLIECGGFTRGQNPSVGLTIECKISG